MVMPPVGPTIPRPATGASATPRATAVVPGGIPPRLDAAAPGMSMEGALLYRKAIDNRGVRYKSDPGDRHALAKYVSLALFVVFALLVLSGPRLWVRQWGYRQEQLSERIDQLTAVRDQLRVQRGRLENLRRIAALAEIEGLAETDSERYKWTAAQAPEEPQLGTAVARLLRSDR